MPFNRNAGGHSFAFRDDVCAKCGMTRPHFEDNGEPPCPGRKPEAREHITIEDDADDPKPAA
jgi:hypothetical protein